MYHAHVGTPRDTVTLRCNKGFLRAVMRVSRTGPGSAWRAEKAKLARSGRPAWHRPNPIWKYAVLQFGFLALAWVIGGWISVGLVIFQALVPVLRLELTNYIENYGLTRRHLGAGVYEPVQPHHSWDSAHRVSGALLINLQRHADRHLYPLRQFPLLQIHDEAQVPQLPTGYPPTTAIAMVPSLWRRMFNPTVRAWRKQFYPDITDWTPYKNPALKGAG